MFRDLLIGVREQIEPLFILKCNVERQISTVDEFGYSENDTYNLFAENVKCAWGSETANALVFRTDSEIESFVQNYELWIHWSVKCRPTDKITIIGQNESFIVFNVTPVGLGDPIFWKVIVKSE